MYASPPLVCGGALEGSSPPPDLALSESEYDSAEEVDATNSEQPPGASGWVGDTTPSSIMKLRRNHGGDTTRKVSAEECPL